MHWAWEFSLDSPIVVQLLGPSRWADPVTAIKSPNSCSARLGSGPSLTTVPLVFRPRQTDRGPLGGHYTLTAKMAHFRSSHQALRRLLGQHQNPSADRITNSLLFTAQGLRFRKLEVILTSNIDKLGKAGDTVKVAPGYFRNYLMPKLLAVPNIDKFVYLVREQRKLYQREEEETAVEVSKENEEIPETSLDDTGLPKIDKMKEYQTAAVRLHNGCLGLRRLIKVDNELRRPVTKEELVAEVARQLGVCIYPENLHLPAPLTTVGQYEVPLRLPREIPRPEGTLLWTLKVKVRRKRSGNETTFKSPSSDQVVAEAVPS